MRFIYIISILIVLLILLITGCRNISKVKTDLSAGETLQTEPQSVEEANIVIENISKELETISKDLQDIEASIS